MAGRGKGKQGIPAFTDFIALGSKGSSGGGAPKRGGDGTAGTSGTSHAHGHPHGTSSLAKKPKITAGPGTGPSPGSSYPGVASKIGGLSVWESFAIDVGDASSLTTAVIAAQEEHDIDKAEGLLCGAVKILRTQRAKPDQLLYLSLMYLAKSNHHLFFASEHVLEAFSSLLKRDVKESYKSKGNSLVSVLAANVLMAAFQKERNWPEIFVRVFIEDAMGERVWVEHPDCKGFVENIMTAFGTKMPPAHGLFGKPPGEGGRENCASPPVGGTSGGGSGSGSGSATPTRVTDEDSLDQQQIPMVLDAKDLLDVTVVPRYQALQPIIESFVMDIVREQMNRRQGTDNITRSFLKFLISACGLVDVRHTVISKVEMWIMNPKVSRVAQELLMTVAMNCNSHSQNDMEILVSFSKLRFKNKPNINLYLQCTRELCLAHPDNLPALLKHVIFNELSNARNMNNMAILSVIFNCDPERGASGLAGVFCDLLLHKDCYLRALRMLLREIVRALRHEVNLVVFCQQLMVETRNKESLIKDFEPKDRLIVSIADILTLSMFISISPAVREAVNAYHRGDDKRDLTPFKNFLKQIATIQSHALWWFHEVVPRISNPNSYPYAKILHKVLFSGPHEEYYNIDGWPGEVDRHVYFKAIAEIPLIQDTVVRIFAIGQSHLPLNGRDTIDLVELLVKKAAGLRFGDSSHRSGDGNTSASTPSFPILECDKPEDMLDRLFELSAYKYPDTITLPTDYNPPSLAIATAYWKAWIILVFYVAHNPSVFGPMVWAASYPTLRAFMEMCITSQFVFPPPTSVSSGAEAEMTKSKELNKAALEKQTILTLEKHLAAATSKDTITEANSLLLPQLTTRDPRGLLRKPPQWALDLLRTLNASYKLGHLLCRSRNPDFLLDILQRQGTNQEMPWLADLVESSEGALNVLPVQCLCEFLLNSNIDFEEAEPLPTGAGTDEPLQQAAAGTNKEREVKKRKQKQLLLHLQTLLQRPGECTRASGETLEYFLRRLASQQMVQRSQALKGLRKVLTPIQFAEDDEDEVQIMHVDSEEGDEDSRWLLQHLPRLPCFRQFYPHIASFLRSACQVENDPNVVGWYIQFMAHFPPEDLGDLADLCLDMASIIVERSSILPAILPGPLCKSSSANETLVALLTLFNKYMTVLMDGRFKALHEEWTRGHMNEIITVVWSNQQQQQQQASVTLHFFVVHAQIILLTFKPEDATAKRLFRDMLSFWFPPQGGMPRAYYASLGKDDIQEEAQLIPDWLKLKMIRSDVSVLVDAALQDLDPQQLVLFIQSFGIPVKSMSKLLSALDQAVVSDLNGVSDAVMDKSYMGQLVAVQHRRGATGGQTFADQLQLDLDAHARHPPGQADDSTLQIGRTQPPVIPPRSTALIPPSQVKNTLLHIFDVGSPGRMTMMEKQDTFRTLQKFLTAELRSNGPTKPMLDATVKALESILKSDLKDPFVNAAVSRTAFSCGLYRLVSTALLRPAFEGSQSKTVLLKISENLLQLIQKKQPDSKTPLINLLNGFISKVKGGDGSKGSSSSTAASVPAKKKKQRDELEQGYQELKAISSTEDDKDLEKHLKEVVEKALKKRSTKSLVNAMSRILLEEEHLNAPAAKSSGKKLDSPQHHVSSGVKAKAGLFVDWLGKLDPELIQSNPEIQQQLLFSKSILEVSGNGDEDPQQQQQQQQTCQPYLLTMLTHQASWGSLRATIESVLGSHNPELQPSSVLDFLTACIYIPKLWHGRDKHKPKHETPPDVLALDGPQLLVMIDYHLQEILEAHGDAEISNLFKERMPLIMRCVGEKHKARSVVEYLYEKIASFDAKDMSDEETAKEKQVTQEFLLQIYMKIPHCVLHLADPQSFLPLKIASSGNSSTVDSLSHTLLSALAATQHGRQWAVQMQDFESAARKVASCHPLLMLRNLPLIAASLKGRTEYDFSFFRARNHLTLYHISLGLMELLQPFIFRPEYTEPLHGALKCYFEMIESYFGRRESILGLIDKFMTFLHDYLEHQPQKAARFIQAQGSMILPDLQKAMPSLMSLKQLVATINFDSSSSAGAAAGSNYSVRNRREAGTDINRFAMSLRSSNVDEETAGILSDICNASTSRPFILKSFVNEINQFLSHPSKAVRTQAYNLLLKYLRYSPKSCDDIVPSYIGCLESSDPGISLCALEKLADVCVLAQDRMSHILQTAFCLGLYSAHTNVTQYIVETINVMNVQEGY